MRLASNSSGPGLVRLVKHSHRNRPASVLAASGPYSRSRSLSNQSVASSAQVTLFSVKSPPPADLARLPRLKLVLFIDTSKAP